MIGHSDQLESHVRDTYLSQRGTIMGFEESPHTAKRDRLFCSRTRTSESALASTPTQRGLLAAAAAALAFGLLVFSSTDYAQTGTTSDTDAVMVAAAPATGQAAEARYATPRASPRRGLNCFKQRCSHDDESSRARGREDGVRRLREARDQLSPPGTGDRSRRRIYSAVNLNVAAGESTAGDIAGAPLNLKRLPSHQRLARRESRTPITYVIARPLCSACPKICA